MVSTGYNAYTGIEPMIMRPKYKTYKSPHGPNYKTATNFRGMTLKSASRLGATLGGFAAVAGVTALFLASDVPRVRKDIMQNIPIIGHHFIREIPSSDNPF